MDTKVWKAAQRTDFPYNISLEWIVGLPFVFPLIAFLYQLCLINIRGDNQFLKTAAQTIVMSIIAFYVSDKLIDVFKESLCKKGL